MSGGGGGWLGPPPPPRYATEADSSKRVINKGTSVSVVPGFILDPLLGYTKLVFHRSL